MKKFNALIGILSSLVASFLVIIVFAYLFRIPIPLGGYLGPAGDIDPYTLPIVGVLKGALIVWIAYGLMGGFIILSILGGATGVLTGNRYQHSAKKNIVIVVVASLVSIIPIFILSIMDYIIGPW